MEERFKYRIFMSVLELIPHIWPTPLVRLSSLSNSGREVYGKLEYFNPFSKSIKDRPVWNMIFKAYEKCVECKKLYEATSGNVGIAMASISNAIGIKFRVYLPKTVPDQTITLLKILGAEIVRTEYTTIDDRVVEYVKREAEKDKALNLNQFWNDDNFEAHYKYTAPEIEKQLEVINKNPPTAIVAGIGTSGHISALSKYFKEKYGGRVKIIGVVPAKGDKIPGIKRLETNPKWVKYVEIDEVVEVSRREAIEKVLYIARREGLLLGLSSGAVVRAYEEIRDTIGPGVYVLVFPDDVFKYVNVIGKVIDELTPPK